MDDSERDELLGRLDERTENIQKDTGKMEKHLDKLNNRTSDLEKWRSRLVGGFAAVAVAAPFFIYEVRQWVSALFS